VNEHVSHSQRAQTPSRAAHKSKQITLSERLAFSPRELAAALGKSPTYIYRLIYAHRLRPIWDAGRMLIPRVEVDRFLARAADYNPQVKPKQNPGRTSDAMAERCLGDHDAEMG
jgi:excisionase family DNA binding protein